MDTKKKNRYVVIGDAVSECKENVNTDNEDLKEKKDEEREEKD